MFSKRIRVKRAALQVAARWFRTVCEKDQEEYYLEIEREFGNEPSEIERAGLDPLLVDQGDEGGVYSSECA